MKIRKSEDRGVTAIGWLDSKHSFSFGSYQDNEHMGYRSLRVINDDIISPGQGFGMHAHSDMEIVSLVIEGGLEHQDSLGHGEVLRPGEVQVMSAGTGIRHSEFNPSPSERVHLIQIWILPERQGLDPTYAQRCFEKAARTNTLLRVAGPKRAKNDEALEVHQDADVYLVRVEPGQTVRHPLAPDRGAWVHLIVGAGELCGTQLTSGDAASFEGPTDKEIVLTARGKAAEFVLFDLS